MTLNHYSSPPPCLLAPLSGRGQAWARVCSSPGLGRIFLFSLKFTTTAPKPTQIILILPPKVPPEVLEKAAGRAERKKRCVVSHDSRLSSFVNHQINPETNQKTDHETKSKLKKGR